MFFSRLVCPIELGHDTRKRGQGQKKTVKSYYWQFGTPPLGPLLPLHEMAIFSLFLFLIKIDRSKRKEQKMQSDFFRKFDYLGYLSFKFLKFFCTSQFGSFHKKIGQEKNSKKCWVTRIFDLCFFYNFDFFLIFSSHISSHYNKKKVKRKGAKNA